MVQVIIEPQQHKRLSIPVVPTLVLGLGDFGFEVGEQLVARLKLTEESLKRDGLVGSLLAQAEDEHRDRTGFVRVMHLDWKAWIAENCDASKLLYDVEVPTPVLVDKGTRPRQREDDRHPDDWDLARNAFLRSDTHDMLVTVSDALRTHDTPIRMGPYSVQPRMFPFVMRLIVVGAAREAATAELGPDLIKLLGKMYVEQETIVKGVQVFCYVGCTPRREHLRASGNATEFDELLEHELARILPEDRHIPFQTTSSKSFLDRIDELWKYETPPLIESCYLIDSQLANNVVAVQQREDEPDEPVVATALAINMLITSDVDRKVRVQVTQQEASQMTQEEVGPFATLGISAYSLDHPRLRRLVYNYITGKFLLRAHPEMRGDNAKGIILGDSEEHLLDEQMEIMVGRDIEQLGKAYKKAITYRENVRTLLPHTQQAHEKLDYHEVVTNLAHLRHNTTQLIDEVENAIQNISNDFERSAIDELVWERQQQFVSRLDDTFSRFYEPLYENEQAPLTHLYRFIKRSHSLLEEEADQAQALPVGSDLEEDRNLFADSKSQRLANKLDERKQSIRLLWRNYPNQRNIVFRVLLLAVVLAFFWNKLMQQLQGLIPLPTFPLHFTLPFWGSTCIFALLSWGLFTLFYQWDYRQRLRNQLDLIVGYHRKLLKDADIRAWQLALTEHLTEQEGRTERASICKPHGMLSKIRQELLYEQFILQQQDRVLERILFDEQLLIELRTVAEALATHDRLWKVRGRFLHDLLGSKWRSQGDLKEWFQVETGIAYQGDTAMIVDLVESFLHRQTEQRLNEIWQDLLDTATPFLQKNMPLQDDMVVNLELFSIHNLEQFQELEALIQRSGVDVLTSVDRLRWMFITVRVGLLLEHIQLSAERFITQ